MARKQARQRLQGLGLVEVVISGLAHDGRGVATREGKKLFVEDALPGERALVRFVESHRSYDVARAETILEAAPERVEPRCSAFGSCGGCALQHLNGAAQIELKQQQLIDNLHRIGKVKAAAIAPPLHGEPWGYRRKARLGVRFVRAKERLLIGFRERRGSFIAAMEVCPVLHPAIGERITELTALIQSLAGYETIAQLEVAIDDTQSALVVRHLAPLGEADRQRLIEFAQQSGIIFYLQPQGPASITPLWPLEPQLSYTLPDFHLTYQFEPSDFTQVNSAINRQMVAQALDWLNPQPTDRVLDLFCGLGNFTLALATVAAEVVGVEGSGSLVERAAANAELNGLTNVTFHAADLTQPVTVQPWWAGPFQRVLLDPARTGALELMVPLAQLKAEAILYVSCNPATLARDAAVLVQHGYRLERAGILDMFPHTAHVESMALFLR